MRLRGLNKLSMDAKGRLAMPKGHRQTLDLHSVSELVITADMSKCLNIFPTDVWQRIESELLAVKSGASKKIRWLQRLYIGYATPVELDSAGRMLLSPELREYAGIGIERKVILVGQGNKFELWDERRWNYEQNSFGEEDFDLVDMPEALKNLSF